MNLMQDSCCYEAFAIFELVEKMSNGYYEGMESL